MGTCLLVQPDSGPPALPNLNVRNTLYVIRAVQFPRGVAGSIPWVLVIDGVLTLLTRPRGTTA
jgi:hypothetical protein